MNCVSALSTAPETQTALDHVLNRVEAAFPGEPADLALVFGSAHHAGNLEKVAGALLDQGRARHVIGCTGESVLGEDREIEDAPALAVWAISLPGVSIQPIRFGQEGTSPPGWNDPITDPGRTVMLLLGDPFSFPVDGFLKQVNDRIRGLRIVGGMASGSQTPGGNQLVLDRESFHDGAVAVLLDGPVEVLTVVSQGCRPIGKPMIVTRAEKNLIRELGRRPTLEVLRETFRNLPEEDQRRVQEGLHIGRVINEYQESFQRGDFLVRNIMGADESGAIEITDMARVGQTVQFHVRDADTANEDLRESLLQGLKKTEAAAAPVGALVFSCNGRGTRMFHQPDHDVSVVHEVCGAIPVAGFFAMGEIGPVGGQNFVHGYTASVVLFAPPQSQAS